MPIILLKLPRPSAGRLFNTLLGFPHPSAGRLFNTLFDILAPVPVVASFSYNPLKKSLRPHLLVTLFDILAPMSVVSSFSYDLLKQSSFSYDPLR